MKSAILLCLALLLLSSRQSAADPADELLDLNWYSYENLPAYRYNLLVEGTGYGTSGDPSIKYKMQGVIESEGVKFRSIVHTIHSDFATGKTLVDQEFRALQGDGFLAANRNGSDQVTVYTLSNPTTLPKGAAGAKRDLTRLLHQLPYFAGAGSQPLKAYLHEVADRNKARVFGSEDLEKDEAVVEVRFEKSRKFVFCRAVLKPSLGYPLVKLSEYFDADRVWRETSIEYAVLNGISVPVSASFVGNTSALREDGTPVRQLALEYTASDLRLLTQKDSIDLYSVPSLVSESGRKYLIETVDESGKTSDGGWIVDGKLKSSTELTSSSPSSSGPSSGKLVSIGDHGNRSRAMSFTWLFALIGLFAATCVFLFFNRKSFFG